MKKESLLVSGFMLAMVAAAGGYHVFTCNSSIEEKLLLENVEALSQKEFEYPNGYPYRSTCNVAIGAKKNMQSRSDYMSRRRFWMQYDSIGDSVPL